MKYAFETNPGKVREKNEDTCLIVENKYGDVLMMVFDGMGGHSKGDLASNKAKEYISSQFAEKRFFSFKIKSWIKKVLRKTNSMLFRLSNEQPRLKGMGTTVTLFLIHKFIKIKHIYLILATAADTLLRVIISSKNLLMRPMLNFYLNKVRSLEMKC